MPAIDISYPPAGTAPRFINANQQQSGVIINEAEFQRQKKLPRLIITNSSSEEGSDEIEQSLRSRSGGLGMSSSGSGKGCQVDCTVHVSGYMRQGHYVSPYDRSPPGTHSGKSHK